MPCPLEAANRSVSGSACGIQQHLDERVPFSDNNWVATSFSQTGKGIMCFAEDQIKEAILHPDLDVRDRAASYFAKSDSPDPSIMPLVIQAVETHGRQDAY